MFNLPGIPEDRGEIQTLSQKLAKEHFGMAQEHARRLVPLVESGKKSFTDAVAAAKEKYEFAGHRVGVLSAETLSAVDSARSEAFDVADRTIDLLAEHLDMGLSMFTWANNYSPLQHSATPPNSYTPLRLHDTATRDYSTRSYYYTPLQHDTTILLQHTTLLYTTTALHTWPVIIGACKH